MISRLTTWFQSLQQREQVIVGVGSLVVLAMIGYFQIWEPIKLSNERLKQEIRSERNLNIWFKQQTQLHLAEGGGAVDEASIATLVEASLRERNLSAYVAQMFKDTQDQTIVQLDVIPYTDFVNWLLELQEQHAVILKDASIQRLEKQGYVDAKVVLTYNLSAS